MSFFLKLSKAFQKGTFEKSEKNFWHTNLLQRVFLAVFFPVIVSKTLIFSLMQPGIVSCFSALLATAKLLPCEQLK